MAYKGFLKEHQALSVLCYAVSDLIAIVGSAFAVFQLRFGDLDMPLTYHLAIVYAVLLALVIFPQLRMYDSWRGRSLVDEAGILLLGWGGIMLVLVFTAFVLKASALYSRLWFGFWALDGWGALLVGRLIGTLLLRRLRTLGWNQRHIVIVGAGPLARSVVERIQATPGNGLNVSLILSASPEDEGKTIGGFEVSSELEQIETTVDKGRLDEVWICLPLEQQKTIQHVLHLLRHSTVTQRLVPDMGGIRLIRHPVTEILSMPMVNLTVSPVHGINRLIKAAEDRFFALVFLALTSPVMLAIALAIKLTSPGPVLFRQTRVGWNNQPFTILKFRTMPVDAEKQTGPVWARRGENRATRLGSFLRKTSLDELPQFINVLKGDMSIVGPRPERQVFVDAFKEEIPGYMQKHLMKAGITGWAQINGWRGSTDLKKRIEHDLYYIENWSLWFDLKIMALTVFRGFVHRNAY